MNHATIEFMNKEHIKVKLEQEKKLLESELVGLGRYNTTLGEWEATPEAQINPEADQNDLADRAEGFEERTSTMAPLQARLEDIHNALKNIDQDTYGMCDMCSKEIEEDRLEANPAARTCKTCMNKIG